MPSPSLSPPSTLRQPGPLSPRIIFDPLAAAPTVSVPLGRRDLARALIGFYRDPLSWLALAVTSAVLCYVGGLIMFWFHAVELGEGGPAISWYAHWMLDSTVAFVALTPALALIIPLSVHWSGVVTGSGRPRLARATYAVIAGGLFAVATVPGPVVHDAFVGRGTWLADRVTAWIGDPAAALGPGQEYDLSAALTQQLGAAVTIYLVLTLVAAMAVRALVAARGGRAAGPLVTAPARNAGATAEGACDD